MTEVRNRIDCNGREDAAKVAAQLSKEGLLSEANPLILPEFFRKDEYTEEGKTLVIEAEGTCSFIRSTREGSKIKGMFYRVDKGQCEGQSLGFLSGMSEVPAKGQKFEFSIIAVDAKNARGEDIKSYRMNGLQPVVIVTERAQSAVIA